MPKKQIKEKIKRIMEKCQLEDEGAVSPDWGGIADKYADQILELFKQKKEKLKKKHCHCPVCITSSTLELKRILKSEKEKLLERMKEELKKIPIDFYKGRGFEGKEEPLIEESKIQKILETLKQEIKKGL